MTVDRSAVGRKSCRKGKHREREFARELSRWWTNDKDPKAFRRTPLSGGWLMKHSQGDVVPVTPEAELFPFLTEVKDRKEIDEFDFADLLTNENCSVLKWWKTLNETITNNPRMNAGKKRLMVLHKNRKDYCVIGIPELKFLEDRAGRFPYIKIWTPFTETLVVFPLDSLFDADPESLKTKLSETQG
jgi:hypothetical protein